jgi:hypothetical protein
MSLPRFTAEASLAASGAHYFTGTMNAHGIRSAVTMAQFMPGVVAGPIGRIDLPIDWQRYEVAGATEVVCDDRCLRRCYAQNRLACQGDPFPTLCAEEMRPFCRPKCCIR